MNLDESLAPLHDGEMVNIANALDFTNAKVNSTQALGQEEIKSSPSSDSFSVHMRKAKQVQTEPSSLEVPQPKTAVSEQGAHASKDAGPPVSPTAAHGAGRKDSADALTARLNGSASPSSVMALGTSWIAALEAAASPALAASGRGSKARASKSDERPAETHDATAQASAMIALMLESAGPGLGQAPNQAAADPSSGMGGAGAVRSQNAYLGSSPSATEAVGESALDALAAKEAPARIDTAPGFAQWLAGAQGGLEPKRSLNPAGYGPEEGSAQAAALGVQALANASAAAFAAPADASAKTKSGSEISMRSPEAFADSASAFAIKAAKDGISHAVLRVAPEALGPMRAEITMSKMPDGSSTISMTLTLANANAMDVAKQGLDKLQTALGAAGLAQAQIELKFDTPVAASSQGASMQASTHSGHQGGHGRWAEQAGSGRMQGSGAASDASAESPWVSLSLFDRSA